MEQVGKKLKIEGLELFPLKEVPNDKGPVLHMLRSDSSYFKKLGEVYFSVVYEDVFKGFKRHLKMTQLMAVPIGLIEFVIYDKRKGSATEGITEKILLGRPSYYGLLKIPPLLWYGFRGLARGESLIVNCTDLPHDSGEVERCDKLSE